jgi:hypothetical protein
MVGLRWYERAGDAVPSFTPKMPVFLASGISKEMGFPLNKEEPRLVA